MKKPSTINQTEWRHCPSCRRIRPTKNLGRVTIRSLHLDVVECQEPSCSLRWCVDRRITAASPLAPIGAAA